MNLVDVQDGGPARKKKPVPEVVNEDEGDQNQLLPSTADQHPVMQFEANLVDDSTANGAKKKKVSKAADGMGEDEETLLTS